MWVFVRVVWVCLVSDLISCLMWLSLLVVIMILWVVVIFGIGDVVVFG